MSSKFPSIPDATSTPSGILAAVQALTEAVRLLTGQRGNDETTAITVSKSTKVVDQVASTIKASKTNLDKDIAEVRKEFKSALSDVHTAIGDWLNGLSSATDDIKVELHQLVSTVGDNTAAINQANVTRANADFALAGQINTLSATVQGNSAAIATESVTRTTADTALAGRIDSLTTTVGNNSAAINQEVIVRSNADQALGVRIDNLTAQTGNNISAAIQAERAVRTDAENAIARDVNTLSATVGTHTSTLTTLSSSVNGLSVNYQVLGTIDGTSGGFRFQGVKNLATGETKFNTIFDSNVTINGNLLVNGSTPTSAIAPNAITNGTSGAGYVSCSSAIAVPAGGNLMVICNLNEYLRCVYTPFSAITFRLYLAGQLAGSSIAAPLFIFDRNNNSVSTDYPNQTRVFTWRNDYGFDFPSLSITFSLEGIPGFLSGAGAVSFQALVFKR